MLVAFRSQHLPAGNTALVHAKEDAQQHREAQQGANQHHVAINRKADYEQNDQDVEQAQQQHGADLLEAHGQDAVVNMVFVGGEGRTAGHHPQGEHAQSIEQRHKQNTHRYGGRSRAERLPYAQAHLNELNGQHRYNKAANQRAGVAHENGGAVEVVAQEAQHAPNQADGHIHVVTEGRATVGVEIKPEGAGNNQHNRARQTVEAIDEVDGIGDTHNYCQGEGIAHSDGEGLDAQNALEAGDADVSHYHHNAGGQQLAHELLCHRHTYQVVLKPHEKQDDAARQQLLNAVRLIERSEDGEGRHEAGKYSYPAQAGREGLVHRAPIGRIEHILEVGNVDNGWHRKQRHQKGPHPGKT